jgi:hypothetical protein
LLLPLLLKALPTKNGPPLRGLKGHRGFLSTLRASGPSFGPVRNLTGSSRPKHGNPLRLAGLAPLWFVLELLVVEEQLFACGKNKVGTAVDTLEYLVLEVHPSPHSPVACAGGKLCLPHARSARRVVTHPPSDLPLDSAHLRVTQVTAKEKKEMPCMTASGIYATKLVGERNGPSRQGRRPAVSSILFLTGFFAAAFASERFFDTLLFAGLQVKGVSLDLLDDVFLLHPTLKTPQCVLEGFTLVKSDFRQLATPPNSSRWTR